MKYSKILTFPGSRFSLKDRLKIFSVSKQHSREQKQNSIIVYILYTISEEYTKPLKYLNIIVAKYLVTVRINSKVYFLALQNVLNYFSKALSCLDIFDNFYVHSGSTEAKQVDGV